MSSIDHILIPSCPLCQIFLNPKENVHTKLYWPEFDEIREADFVIIECDSCKIPMCIPRDHVPNLSKEMWGRILYRTRKLFGTGVRLRYKPRKLPQHYHCHIIAPKKEY